LGFETLTNENGVILESFRFLAQCVYPLIITSQREAKAFPHRRFFIWRSAPVHTLELEEGNLIPGESLGARRILSHLVFMIGRHSTLKARGFRLVAL
jgi:hypothetical protein